MPSPVADRCCRIPGQDEPAKRRGSRARLLALLLGTLAATAYAGAAAPVPDDSITSGSVSAGTTRTTSATITVDTGITLNTFRPADIFGVNMMPYVDRANYLDVRDKLQAVGNVFARYPSGIANDTHWNGTGTFDANGWWVPDDTRYSPSFQGFETFRGTTSGYGRPSLITDGDTTTRWLSNADTDLPSAQWVYVDLGTPLTVDAVSVDWSTPRAMSFTVQYWNPASSNQWAPYMHTSNDWINTSAEQVSGKDGAQRVSFMPVTSRYIRILMTASQAKPPQYSMAELRVFSGATQLTTNTRTMTQIKPDQAWTVASSADPACTKQSTYSLDFESFMEYVGSLSPPVAPMITVNCGGATPQEAAAWVHYANKVRRYGIKYWEIGNEMNGNWETGGPLSARDYSRRYIRFYEVMKAVDPTITICGPGADANWPSGDYDGKTYVEAFIDRLAAESKATYAEAIDFHWYPFQDAAGPWGTVAKMTALPGNMDRWLKNHPGKASVPMLLTEFNSGGSTPFTTRIENGLWLVATLGEFIRGFGSRGATSYWTVIHSADAVTNADGGDHSYLQLDTNPWQYQERPAYWAMMMMAACWAIPGDTSSHALVAASSDKPYLLVYADRRPDKVLSLIVANRHTVESYDTKVDLGGVSPKSEARRWTFDTSNYAWTTASLPYHADPDTPPTAGIQSGVAPSFRYTFAPNSLTVFQFTQAAPVQAVSAKRGD